jgi:hypothetical protein
MSLLRHRANEITLTAARRSQAVVIYAVDRLARTSPHGAPRLVGRLWTMQLRAMDAVLNQPADLLDDAYVLTGRLVELHRQFAQRLLEAMDTRNDATSPTREDDGSPAPVVVLR